jgi:dihydrofolate reductase
LVDEFFIALAPVVFGAGRPLFDEIDPRQVTVKNVEAIHSPLVTHLRYEVTKW